MSGPDGAAFRPDFGARDDFPGDFDALSEAERERILSERVRLLHVYGQHAQHSPLGIVGNRNGLTVLRDAIDAVLRGEYRPRPPDAPAGRAMENHTSAMTSDGEGYSVVVELVERPWGHREWETRPLPYTDPVLHGKPDPTFAIAVLKNALRAANAALYKRGAKPVPMPDLGIPGSAKTEGT